MRHLSALTIILLTSLLYACGNQEAPSTEAATSEAPVAPTTTAEAPAAATAASTNVQLAAVLAAQPAETQARYVYRHPQETLQFFGIEPGMTVAEALPGGGWYSKILLEYLGSDGHLVGVNYAPEIWPNFGFATEEFLANIVNWSTTWPAGAEEWRSDNSATVSAFVFGAVDPEMNGKIDAVLFIRALHNMARFEDQRAFLDEAMLDSFAMLKPGGIMGIVQHHARDNMPDAWADGSNGYLKQQFIIDKMTTAGFEYAGASDVNQNPADQPTNEDFVWRLPPSLRTSSEDPVLAAELTAVGESNRMTLKFRKPV